VAVDNFNKFLMASNESWTIPAGADERRFCCIDISDERAQDHQYFADLQKEMMHPGFYPTLLRYLLDHRYNCADVRKVPNSIALTEQKLHSLGPVEEWWFEHLQDSEDLIPEWVSKGFMHAKTGDLYGMYLTWCAEKNRPRYARNIFCKDIFGEKGLCPSAKKKRGTDNERKWGYLLPDISQCKREFEIKMGSVGKITW